MISGNASGKPEPRPSPAGVPLGHRPGVERKKSGLGIGSVRLGAPSSLCNRSRRNFFRMNGFRRNIPSRNAGKMASLRRDAILRKTRERSEVRADRPGSHSSGRPDRGGCGRNPIRGRLPVDRSGSRRPSRDPPDVADPAPRHESSPSLPPPLPEAPIAASEPICPSPRPLKFTLRSDRADSIPGRNFEGSNPPYSIRSGPREWSSHFFSGKCETSSKNPRGRTSRLSDRRDKTEDNR